MKERDIMTAPVVTVRPNASVDPVRPRAIDSASSQHKRAAADHELAGRQHRRAASLYDQQKWRAANLASASAMACADKAHKQSISAFERSKRPPRKA